MTETVSSNHAIESQRTAEHKVAFRITLKRSTGYRLGFSLAVNSLVIGELAVRYMASCRITALSTGIKERSHCRPIRKFL